MPGLARPTNAQHSAMRLSPSVFSCFLREPHPLPTPTLAAGQSQTVTAGLRRAASRMSRRQAARAGTGTPATTPFGDCGEFHFVRSFARQVDRKAYPRIVRHPLRPVRRPLGERSQTAHGEAQVPPPTPFLSKNPLPTSQRRKCPDRRGLAVNQLNSRQTPPAARQNRKPSAPVGR